MADARSMSASHVLAACSRMSLPRLAITTGACLLALTLALPAGALSTDRAANLFSGDEDFIVLSTTASSPAKWTLTNDYGEKIAGQAEVVEGKIRIATYGLRFGRYTFAVEGDGKVVGGLVPPLIDRSPRFTRLILAAPQFHRADGDGHWKYPEEALMWKQFEVELRHEFQLEPMNPAKGQYTYRQDFDEYSKALKKYNVAHGLKFGGAPKWNGGREVEPKDYPAYEESLRTIAAHYYPLGLDRYWISNEPETAGWWKSGWDGYYRFLAGSAKAVRAVSPDITVNAPECWAYRPEFLDTVLKSHDATVLSVHYPGEDASMDPHSWYYTTEMRKTGVWVPMLNGESHAGPNNFAPANWNKFYLGVGANATGFGYGVSLIGNIDFGIQKTCWMFKSDTNLFDSYKPGNIVAHECGFTVRNVTDEMAGSQMRRRLTEAPPTVVGWLFRRGSDNFVTAFLGEPVLTQMMEIATSAPRLRIVDLFGNEYTATPVDGKVRVLLTTSEVYVHGVTDSDTFSFPLHDRNEVPEIADPGQQKATLGLPYRLKIDGRDPDMVLLADKNQRLPIYRLTQAPEGMTIRAGSGLIEWTPKEGGAAPVTVELVDIDGGKVSRSFSVNVQPTGGNLPPQFVSRSTQAGIVNQPCRYQPKVADPNGDKIKYTVQGPTGMVLADGIITWTPTATGVSHVQVTADDGQGGQAIQWYEVVVVTDPDRTYDGGMAPLAPSYLTVTDIKDGVTLVWNTRGLGTNIVQRSPNPRGPWQEVGATDGTWFKDVPPAGPAYYRVLTKNLNGLSDVTSPVNGRNRMPIADAGRSAKPAEPGEFPLDGSQSVDPEGKPLTYQWTIHAAPRDSEATLKDPTTVKPTLVAGAPGRYVVSLRVSDGEEVSWPHYVRIYVGAGSDAREAVADAGPVQFVPMGETVTMNGWTSPVDKLKWLWRRNDMPIDAYTPFTGDWSCYKQTSTFVPSAPGVYEMQLTTSSDWVVGFPDITQVIVTPEPGSTPLPASSDKATTAPASRMISPASKPATTSQPASTQATSR